MAVYVILNIFVIISIEQRILFNYSIFLNGGRATADKTM